MGDWTRWIVPFLLAFAIGGGCYNATNHDSDAGDADADSDSDVDVDADSDSDVDADGDTDSDAGRSYRSCIACRTGTLGARPLALPCHHYDVALPSSTSPDFFSGSVWDLAFLVVRMDVSRSSP